MIIFHSEFCHKRGWFPEGPPKIISGEGGCFFPQEGPHLLVTRMVRNIWKHELQVLKQCQIGRFPKSWISRISHGFHKQIVSWLGGFQIGHPFFFWNTSILHLWLRYVTIMNELQIATIHVPLSCSPCLKAGFRRWNNRLSGWKRTWLWLG